MFRKISPISWEISGGELIRAGVLLAANTVIKMSETWVQLVWPIYVVILWLLCILTSDWSICTMWPYNKQWYQGVMQLEIDIALPSVQYQYLLHSSCIRDARARTWLSLTCKQRPNALNIDSTLQCSIFVDLYVFAQSNGDMPKCLIYDFHCQNLENSVCLF